jgi:hypothetical protein
VVPDSHDPKSRLIGSHSLFSLLSHACSLFPPCLAVKSGALLNQPGVAGGAVKFDRKLLTGGCDNQIRLWRLNEENGQWYEVRAFVSESGSSAHSDWVRDASFAPSLGLPSNTVASASEDKTVVIWTEDPATGAWRRAKTLRFDTKVYKVSWSLMGNILAVAQGDNQVSLWKESIDGDWKNLSQAQAQQYAQGAGTNSAPMSPAQMTQQHFQQGQQQHPPQQQHQQYQHQQDPYAHQQQHSQPQQQYHPQQPHGQPPQHAQQYGAPQHQQQHYGGPVAY